jgi:hypothetical protein
LIFIKINQCSVIRFDTSHDFSFKELFGLDFDTGITKTEKNGTDLCSCSYCLSIGPKNDIEKFGQKYSINWQKVKEIFSNIFKF